MSPTPLSDCAKYVREHDNDRFLSVLFAPADYREDLFALYAFNLELSKIRETVSEPLIGRMRLQFWRDAVPQMLEGKPPSHYVAETLAGAVKMHGLSASHLNDIIDMRETDLDDIPPKDLDAVVSYAEGTSSSLIKLAFGILGVTGEQSDACAKDAGVAIALIGLVRAIPYMSSTGRVTLPFNLCRAAGLDPEKPLQWPTNPDVSAITQPMLERAAHHLNAARADAVQLPRSAVPALLPMSLAGLYLRRLQSLGGDPALFAARTPGVSRHVTLLWRSMIGRP